MGSGGDEQLIVHDPLRVLPEAFDRLGALRPGRDPRRERPNRLRPTTILLFFIFQKEKQTSSKSQAWDNVGNAKKSSVESYQRSSGRKIGQEEILSRNMFHEQHCVGIFARVFCAGFCPCCHCSWSKEDSSHHSTMSITNLESSRKRQKSPRFSNFLRFRNENC